jgi:hypothetical protein
LTYKECDHIVKLIAKIDAKTHSLLPPSGSLDLNQGARQMRIAYFVSPSRERSQDEFRCFVNAIALTRAIDGDGRRWDLEQLDALGFEEAWIGEHFTAAWEPCLTGPLIAQALVVTIKKRA